MEEPQFKHDRGCCTFLGRYESDEPPHKYDLYWCDKDPMGPTVMARYSDEGSEYLSGIPCVWAHPCLQEALRRALARGLDCRSRWLNEENNQKLRQSLEK